MTNQELTVKFESGEILSQFFGIRSNSFSIGGTRITERQFKKLLLEYRGRYILDMSHYGFTRHNYTFRA